MSVLPPYQFINIHQRTKTNGILLQFIAGISLSISIRELKRPCLPPRSHTCISLSISIRELKPLICWSNIFQRYQFINIHQRTKTLTVLYHLLHSSTISLSLSKFSVAVLFPRRICIAAYCFSVMSSRRTEPRGGRFAFILCRYLRESSWFAVIRQ